jgi:hypothetical protein
VYPTTTADTNRLPHFEQRQRKRISGTSPLP